MFGSISFCCVLFALSLAACEQRAADKPLQYSGTLVGTQASVNRLVPRPLYNPQKLSATIQPLVDYLNRQVSAANLQLETSKDYQAFEKKFRVCEGAFLMALTAAMLEVLPAALHSELKSALESLTEERIDAALQQVEFHDVALHTLLSRLVENYDYPCILKVLQETSV